MWFVLAISLEFLIYLLAAIPPALLWQVLPATVSWYWLAFYLACCYVLVPLTILLTAGLFCRLLPRPRPGTFPLRPTSGRMDPDVARWLLLTSIAGIPYRSPASWGMPGFPFPAGLFLWLAGARIHPSVAFAPDVRIMDPWLVTIDEGTILGTQVCIAGHLVKKRDEIEFLPNSIGKDVIIGPFTGMSGATIGNGATIVANSMIRPGSVIGPGELWGGTPARRLRKARMAPGTTEPQPADLEPGDED